MRLELPNALPPHRRGAKDTLKGGALGKAPLQRFESGRPYLRLYLVDLVEDQGGGRLPPASQHGC